eukprot:4324887-Alexandrium_andersonii.AAC.1
MPTVVALGSSAAQCEARHLQRPIAETDLRRCRAVDEGVSPCGPSGAAALIHAERGPLFNFGQDVQNA